MKTRKIMNNVLFIVFFTLITLSFIIGVIFIISTNIRCGMYDDVYFTIKDIDWCTTYTVVAPFLFVPLLTTVVIYGNIFCVIEAIEEIKKIRKETL